MRAELDARARRIAGRIEAYVAPSWLERLGGWANSLYYGVRSRALHPREMVLSGGKDALFGVIGQRSTVR